jgi:hypothetical protein
MPIDGHPATELAKRIGYPNRLLRIGQVKLERILLAIVGEDGACYLKRGCRHHVNSREPSIIGNHWLDALNCQKPMQQPSSPIRVNASRVNRVLDGLRSGTHRHALLLQSPFIEWQRLIGPPRVGHAQTFN